MQKKRSDLFDGDASSIIVIGDLLDLDGGEGAFLLLLDGLHLLLLLLHGDLLGLGLVSRALLLFVVAVAGGEVLLPGVGLGPGLETSLPLDRGAPLELSGTGGGRSALGLPLPLAVEAVVVGGLDLGLPPERPLPGARLLNRGPLDLAAAGVGDVGALPGGGGLGAAARGGDGELERGDAVGEVAEEERSVGGRGGGEGEEGVERRCGGRGQEEVVQVGERGRVV